MPATSATTADAGEEQPTPIPTTAAEYADLWDPCHLSESVLAGIGMDLATREAGIADVDFSEAGWKICQWMSTAGWYWLGIKAETAMLEEVKSRTGVTDIVETSAGARRAFQYRRSGASHDLECSIAVEIPQGTVTFSAAARASKGAQEDMCGVAARHTAALERFLPSK